ncbi:MAG: MotA/TolQ/ExbB proton channel family protein [Planctomycetaceae bacterium]|nr:MotA/TolQ/ExbB proton channel family protein [Planctomycetaceae bacterium]
MSRFMKSIFRLTVMMLVLGVCLSAAQVLAQAKDQPAKMGEKALAQAAAAKDKNAAPEKETLLSLIRKGGVVMIPIFLVSIVAVAVAIERFLTLRRSKVIPPTFIEGLKLAFAGDPSRTAEAIAYCDSNPCPLSQVIKGGIRRLDHGYDAVEKGIEDAGGREVYKLKRSLRPLISMAAIEPLLGLLGTVYGLITCFETASAATKDKTQGLARGIYEAMVTTAAGLTIAIPILIVVQILASKVDMLVDNMDDQAIEFLEYSLQQKGK